MIDKKSRYRNTPTVQVDDGAGGVVVLFAVRRVPPSAGFFQRRPVDGERLDHLAHRYYRDPTRFWRIADGSPHLDPDDVVRPGRPLFIPSDR